MERGDVSTYEDLLSGAIDLHCHVDLEFSTRAFRKREPEWQWLPKAEALGMRGVVLKSHWWPTAVAVPYIQQLYQGPVQLWSSITLNPVAGGPELWAVETAAALGARVVFLPTWGSLQDLRAGGFHVRLSETFKTFDPRQMTGIGFLDAQERLSRRGHELLRYCAEHHLTLGTGHVSPAETLRFVEAAKEIGYGRLIFNHPHSGSVKAPPEAARRAAELGAWVELCWGSIAPGRLDPKEAVAWIRQVGVDRVVVSSDAFRSSHPNPPELFRMLLGTLHEAGLTAAEIRMVVVDNPAQALGLEPRQQ